LPHTAGQHGLLTVPKAGTKAFSLASAPGEPQVLIGTHLQSGSVFKKALAELRPGDNVSIRGPILNFTLDRAAVWRSGAEQTAA
jgi:NAD(P)H-flavin reductase